MGHKKDLPRNDRAPRRRRLAVVACLLASVLVAGACGGDEVVTGSAAAGDRQQAPNPDDGQDDGGDPPSDGVVLTESRPDLISGQPGQIDSVKPIDDQTLAVRFSNSSEPCSLANVTTTQTPTSISVELETGLHPNAAAMTCIAQVVDYEIRVTLDQPIGDREILFDQS